jgi:hypothetical protein
MTETSFRALLLGLCLLIFGLSFAALLLAAWRRHRADKGGEGNFHSSLVGGNILDHRALCDRVGTGLADGPGFLARLTRSG